MEEYIVSARKYRPMTFDAVVGQLALTTTLKNAVKSGKLAHAYLFCGPRGVGKTTCARIFAKAINCLTPTDEGEACGHCESCQAFNEQRSLNIFELDAASNNSVEHIKTLMEQTRIPPQVGKYKVFIIDEVHMLSTAAFNAFLKTLEEPPQHVIFILATTEKHKILPTILSRCQIYDFERMTIQGTINHLKYVADKEGIRYEEEALAVIAEKADGGMRDALSIFDQTASFCQGNITLRKVLDDLNVLDADNYFSIIDLALENKVTDIMVLLNNIINKGFDGGLLIGGLAKHVRNVLMAKDESTLSLLEVSQQQRERYQQQAKKCDTHFLYQALRFMNQCDINYRQSGNKRLLVELTLIEIAQITQPDDTPAAGRSPKRLKTLFKQLLQQPKPQNVTPQVVTAKPAVDTPTLRSALPLCTFRSKNSQESSPLTANPSNLNSQEPSTQQLSLNSKLSTLNSPEPSTLKPSTIHPSPSTIIKGSARPALKRALGNSWNKILNKDKGIISPSALISTQQESQPFTDAELQFQWLSMCNRMPQNLSGIAARMKNLLPHISTFPAVELFVENELVKEQIEQIQGKILSTLKLHLHNSDITLHISVIEHEGPVHILTRTEHYEALEKANPSVAKLREVFGLELA